MEQTLAASARPQLTPDLDQALLDVRPGEIFGVLGPTGSGKTSLIRRVAAQLAPEGGQMRTAGQTSARAPGRFGPPAPTAAFFSQLSPMENLLFSARHRERSAHPAETRRRVLAILRLLDLPQAALYRPVGELSPAQQQKVAIARAWLLSLAETRRLVLDQPTTGLDPRSRREVQAFIRALRDQLGASVLLATDDLLEAAQLCDRVAVLNNGRLVAKGTPAALKQRLALPAGPPATLEDVILALTRQPALAEETAHDPAI